MTKHTMKKRVILYFIILIPFVQLLAQVQIYGRIVDEETQVPVVYANVFFESNQGRGAISNQLGAFLIHIYEQDRADHLIISQIGYENYRLSLKELQTDSLLIQMKPSFHQLEGVTVISDRGLRGIIRQAVKNIPQNYGVKKYTLECFFREYSISDSTYAEVMEAFVDIQDGTYKQHKRKSKIFLQNLRRSDDNRNLPSRLQVLNYSQLYQFYESLNPVRIRRLYVFSGDIEHFLEINQLYNRGEMVDKKDTLIRIGFVNRRLEAFNDEELKGTYGTGELLIRKSGFAILKVSRGNAESGSFRQAIYQKYKGKYYLSSLQNAYSFRYDDRSRFFFNAKQLHITKVLLGGKKKKHKGKRMSRDKNLRDVRYTYDPSFWKENTLLLELPAPKALQADLSRVKNMEEQYYGNAKNKKESQ